MLVTLFVFILVSTSFSDSYHVPVYMETYFEQTLDHFNFYPLKYGKSTYQQRYLIQDKWWARGEGPIFFYTGNEGPVDTFWNNTGFVFEHAPTFNALVIYAEHRFYGKSLPFGPEKSFRHPYVDLLTVEQALADYAVLLTHLKEQFGAQDCPVIAFGGSYGGMLTAYFRIKYPHLIVGGIAASAPIHMSASDRDFFFADVTKDFREAVPGCETKAREAFSKMQQVAAQGESGLAQLSRYFNTCQKLSTAAHYRHLVGWLRNGFTILAMMDYPYATDFMANLPAFPVKVACEMLLASIDPLAGLVTVTDLFYGKPKCHDVYTEYVECADPTGCGLGPDSIAWDYQVCTEMVMPAGTNNVTDMFPILPFTLKDHVTYCKTTWGVTPRPEWIHIWIGDHDLVASSNIVFSNGNLDPWRRGGVLKNVSASLVALPVEGGAHHLDLRASHPADPPTVTRARQEEVRFITKWIHEHNQGAPPNTNHLRRMAAKVGSMDRAHNRVFHKNRVL